MKISDKASAALQQSDTQAVAFEMTPERKEKYARASEQIVDLLKASTEGPLDAYMLLQFIVSSFEDCYGIRGGVIVEKDAEQH